MCIPRCTVYKNIYDRNCDYSNETAILYFGNKISYEKLFLHVEKCARALKQVGIKQGDCVTLCTAGVPEAIYIVLACSRIGAIANFINPMFEKQQMIDRINETDAEWIFVLDEMYTYISKALPETCIKNVVVIPVTNSVSPLLSKIAYIKSKAKKILTENRLSEKKYLLWNDFAAFSSEYRSDIDSPYVPDTPTVMVYSSGTTGASKGIQLTNDGINATIAKYQTSGFAKMYDRSSVMLQIIPIWFSTGIVLSIFMPLTQGVTVLLEPRFDPEVLVDDFLKYRPSICLIHTSFWIRVIESERMKKADLSNMTIPFTGGEKVLKKDEDRINAFLRAHGCNRTLYKGYGMCELGSTVSTQDDADGYVSKYAGVGYPTLNTVISVFDIDTDAELKYGEHGEIRVCSPGRMKGYYKNPKATEAFFKTDSEGRVWGCTGDIGYIDEDGEVFVLGRASDCYRRENGEIVYLFDIEEPIFTDESVNQCKVINIEEDGKIKLVAHIVFEEGVENTDEHISKIFDYLIKALPSHMIPDYYKIRTEMPVHVNGKRDLDALRRDRKDLVAVVKKP